MELIKHQLIFTQIIQEEAWQKCLTKIAEGGINLSKLQSFPIPGSDFKYCFHADMEFEILTSLKK